MKFLNLAISLKRVIKATAKSVKEKDVVMQGGLNGHSTEVQLLISQEKTQQMVSL